MRHFAILACLLLAGTASADSQADPGATGNNMKRELAESNTWNSAYWRGYIIAAADGLSLENVICVPEGVEYGQMYSVVQKWLNDNPGELHLAPYLVTFKVLKATWPCAKKGK